MRGAGLFAGTHIGSFRPMSPRDVIKHNATNR